MKTFTVTLEKTGIEMKTLYGILPSGCDIWIKRFRTSEEFNKITIEKEFPK